MFREQVYGVISRKDAEGNIIHEEYGSIKNGKLAQDQYKELFILTNIPFLQNEKDLIEREMKITKRLFRKDSIEMIITRGDN